MCKVPVALAAVATVLILNSPGAGKSPAASAAKSKATANAAEGPAVIWRPPEDITSRDLFYGPGGKAHEPKGTFTFEKEDMQGSNPKFDVIDQNGVRWKVKMGNEARPETAASRLVWAVGYFANEDYFVPVLHVQNMPRLRRGANLVSADGTVHNVRLKRHLKDEKKLGNWAWAHGPFTDTREWNGLRVMMALVNNWDVKDTNNSVYQVHGSRPEQIYAVSDLGGTFGPTGLNWTQRGYLKAYRESKWITKTSSGYVDFGTPAMPALNHWVGRRIPVADARWVGDLLARLSPQQIRDAFRAAGYSPQEVDGFGSVVEQRISQLKGL
jgi:hypothetical protein